ncbi:MAG: D-alanyl-D-alanine carboxypeptidase/D-alanyl-D-alanine-endopeptidase [Bacteroidales bacterium]|nr:D-alanyl-D-alanine carboxypeptidase/D-alanyl-D-alanine-endopeptidase [Bacteroidales bacterium]
MNKLLHSFLLIIVLFLAYNKHFLAQTFTGDSIYIKKIMPLIIDSSWQGSIIAFTAKDITNNKLLVDVNGLYKLNPASIVKLITTGAGLHILGSNYRFKTEFGYTGYIKDSVLFGNIIIKGYGDPTLYSRFFKDYFKKNDPFDSVASKLTRLGVRIVKGKIIGDATFFQYNLPNSTWIVGDVANYYGASPSGLAIYNNEYSLYFSSKDTSRKTNLLNIAPLSVNIELINKVTSANISNDQSIIYGDLFDSTRLIVGNIPFNKDSFEVRGSIGNPALVAATELKKRLQNNNIIINDTVSFRYEYNFTADTTEIVTIIHQHYSPPLSEIVTLTNLYSINIFAEHIARLCGWQRYKNTTPEMACTAVNRFWQKSTGNMILYDGSGLSRYNAVSTQQFINILEFMYNQSSYKKIFFQSLPIAGESGTLSKFFERTKAKGKVFAKTGTMTHIRSLAGYIQPDKKTTIAFCIIVNNSPLPSNLIKQKMENIILQLFFN